METLEIPKKTTFNWVTIITGGKGFLGQHILKNYRTYQEELVIVVDKNTYASRELPKEVTDNKNIIEWNIDINSLPEETVVKTLMSFRPARINILNCAGETHVDNSIVDSSPFFSTNVKGVHALTVLCDKMLDEGISVILSHVSTDEVYGDAESESEPFSINSRFNPSSPYSGSKAAGEMILQGWFKTRKAKPFKLQTKLSLNIIRPCNFIGSGQNEEKFVPTVIRNILNDEPIPVYGDGTQEREWINISIAANFLRDIMVNYASYNTCRIFNLTHYWYSTNIDLIKMIYNLIPKPYKNELCIKFVKDRPAHDKKYWSNASINLKPYSDNMESSIEAVEQAIKDAIEYELSK